MRHKCWRAESGTQKRGELVATACVKDRVLRAAKRKRVTPSNGNGHFGPAAAARSCSPQETPKFTLLPKPVKSLV
jgi:hypothetical protein